MFKRDSTKLNLEVKKKCRPALVQSGKCQRIYANISSYSLKNMTVCSYHVTYAFQSESTLYSCLNVKELLARNRREIGSLSDCNGTRTHNHLVRKRTV